MNGQWEKKEKKKKKKPSRYTVLKLIRVEITIKINVQTLGHIYINGSQKISFFLYYCKTNYCSQLLLCNTLVRVPTATWQMSPPVQHHMENGNCTERGRKGRSASCSPVPVCTKHRTLR
jgi:hypothetical protein